MTMTSGPKRCRTSRQSNSPTSSGDMEIRKTVTKTEPSYPVLTQKGQRKYGPPPNWTEEDLPRGCEVYVSKLPKDILERELVPIFEECGKIYEIRLMMETSELNKGFAFVKYCYRDDCEAAVIQLNNFEIRPNCRISVVKSVDNNRIFIGNIPKNFSENDVLNQMRNISSGVRKVILYPSVNDRTRNRGYGFVEFENHQLAAMARQKYKSAPMVWVGHEIKVDWAEPELEVDDETMKKVRVLYVRNLALSTTEQHLRDLFSSLGGTIERVKKMKDYAFIHFSSRDEAEKAKNKFQCHYLDGCEIDVNWSKPVANREEYQQRKAASKAMLSGSNLQALLPPANLCFNGDLFYGTRVRNAAGAQGYATTTKPYLARPRSENTLASLQPSQLIIPNPFLPTMPYRNPVENLGIQTLQPIYPQERLTAIDDPVSTPPEISYPYSYVMNVIPQISPAWQGQQAYLPQPLAQPSLVPSYYIPQAGLVMDSQYGSTYPFTQYMPGQMLTQVPGISGSNMSIDRS